MPERRSTITNIYEYYKSRNIHEYLLYLILKSQILVPYDISAVLYNMFTNHGN